MNTPTPDFVSRIAGSSQTVSTIEEHNCASAASSLNATHGVSLPPAVHAAALGSIRTAGVDLHGADQSSAKDAPFGLPQASAGIAAHAPFTELPPSRLELDTKGLASALEASSLNDLSQGQSVDLNQADRVDFGQQYIDGYKNERVQLSQGQTVQLLKTSEIGRALATAEELRHVEDLQLWMEDRLGSSVVSQWGIAPGSKKIANLWHELTSGESSLQDSRPPKRTVNVASVKIKNEKGEVLVEAYQEMSDGRRRERNQPLSEKFKPGEGVEEACLRGICEELGADLGSREKVTMISDSYTKKEQERDSISYPGLPTQFIIHSMEARIPQLPESEFSTFEGESEQESLGIDDSAPPKTAVGVNRHFWKWIPESELH
ncbi:unnamed protein product [Calypogeia fissa]